MATKTAGTSAGPSSFPSLEPCGRLLEAVAIGADASMAAVADDVEPPTAAPATVNAVPLPTAGTAPSPIAARAVAVPRAADG